MYYFDSSPGRIPETGNQTRKNSSGNYRENGCTMKIKRLDPKDKSKLPLMDKAFQSLETHSKR